MIRFAIKVGLAGTAVYYLSQEGVWAESEKSLKVYDTLKANLSPYVKTATEKAHIEVPALPDRNQISYLTKQYWNKGVLTTFKFISELPQHVSNVSDKAYNSLMSNSQVKDAMKSINLPMPNDDPTGVKEKQ